jgi:hypothetical protein
MNENNNHWIVGKDNYRIGFESEAISHCPSSCSHPKEHAKIELAT